MGDGVKGARLLVVGASSGIGRATARAAADAGARVVVVGRRAELLEEVVAETGGVAVAADVADLQECRRMAEVARRELGGIDIVFVAAGVTHMRRMVDMGPEDWDALLRTNLVGINNVISTTLGDLSPGAIVAVVSSDSVPAPRPGLVAYAASKAALETALAGWRTEHPEVRFCVVAVGPTVPTDVSRDFDPELLGAMFADWSRLGMLQSGYMDVDQLGRAIAGTFGAVWPEPTIGLDHLLFRPPFPVVGLEG